MLIKYIGVIQKAIYSVLLHTHDPKECRTIICVTNNKNIIKNNEKYVKTGVHLYWPDVCVNAQYALGLRRIIINALEENYGERGSHNKWEDVVDKTVFENNGLRMIGSRKLSNCNHCKTRKQKVCNVCNSLGKIDEGRVYEPLCILDGKGKEMKSEFTKIVTNCVKKIKETSIRTTYTDLPRQLKIPQIYLNSSKINKKRQTQSNNNNIFDVECSNKESLEKNSKAFKLLSKFIHDSFPHPSIDICEIFKKGKEDFYYIVRTSSRFCLNINREHNSNHIYFYIDKSFAYQKCLCTCDTTAGRLYGKCMDYKSSGRKLPNELQKILFPQEKNKNGCFSRLTYI